MKNTFAILAATAAVGLASSSYAVEEAAEVKSNVEYKKDGGFESSRTSEHTSASGTKRTSESKVDVDVDSKGRIEKTVKTESITDPKGLLNKKKDSAKTEITEKPRGGYIQTTTSTHKDADGTNVTLKTVTDVDVDQDWNVTTTAKTEKTVDPEGLLNQTTSTSMIKSVNGRIVEKRSEID